MTKREVINKRWKNYWSWKSQKKIPIEEEELQHYKECRKKLKDRFTNNKSKPIYIFTNYIPRMSDNYNTENKVWKTADSRFIGTAEKEGEFERQVERNSIKKVK